jgi:uncharacterized membrane protein
MPLLMKQRNGILWTAVERTQLARQLYTLTAFSPYLFVLLVPGSFLLFPMVAWWLDRRRMKRRDGEAGAAHPSVPGVKPL